MRLHPTPLPGLTVIETLSSGDERGRFSRIFCDSLLAPLQHGLHFAQVNLSETRDRGTVRGLHCQRPPAAEAKLVRCLKGRVFDVAVDLRAGSPTFLQWFGVELDARQPLQIFIPEGFAHGFQALEEDVELLYMHTAAWNPDAEFRLRHDEQRIGIRWPIPVTRLSDADRNAPPLPTSFHGITQ
jgi:dTDP-4-dehydrorhamnose 3,5-epimerase